MAGIQVNEATFQKEVIDRSHQVPVLVDFWADWCAPCKVLMPVLESVVESSPQPIPAPASELYTAHTSPPKNPPTLALDGNDQ